MAERIEDRAPFAEGELVTDTEHRETYPFRAERDLHRVRTAPEMVRVATPEEAETYRRTLTDTTL